MDYQKLVIRGISYSQNQSGAYALLLEHEASKIKLPIVIGGFEAQAITLGLEKDLKPMRPMTHDLFTHFVKSTQFVLDSIVIYQIIEGVFFSNLNFKNITTQQEIILDARTSDAVAMAVRFNAPIYTTNEVLEEAGILLDDNVDISKEEEEENLTESDYEKIISQTVEDIIQSKNSLEYLEEQELKDLLEQAVADEDFDTALEIQKEIERRNKENL